MIPDSQYVNIIERLNMSKGIFFEGNPVSFSLNHQFLLDHLNASISREQPLVVNKLQHFARKKGANTRFLKLVGPHYTLKEHESYEIDAKSAPVGFLHYQSGQVQFPAECLVCHALHFRFSEEGIIRALVAKSSPAVFKGARSIDVKIGALTRNSMTFAIVRLDHVTYPAARFTLAKTFSVQTDLRAVLPTRLFLIERMKTTADCELQIAYGSFRTWMASWLPLGKK